MKCGRIASESATGNGVMMRPHWEKLMSDNYCWLTKRMARRIWLLMIAVAVGCGLAVRWLVRRPQSGFVIPPLDVEVEWLQRKYGRGNVVREPGGLFVVGQREA